MDFEHLSPFEPLVLHRRVAEALRARGITRSSNNPTGDLAEYLFCRAFGWTQAGNSNANVDAIGRDGKRYQIKGRRMTRHNKSRQLSAIRDLAGLLAGVLLSEQYTVVRAAIIPRIVVEARAKFIAHTNSHKFMLHDDVWDAPSVQDVTEQLRAVTL
jgi:hypothetical protein